MVKISVLGRTVEVDDAFKSLSPEEQQATVDDIGAKIEQGEASSGRNKQLAASRGAVEGLPIVGPYIASGVEHAAAALRAPFTDKDFSQELEGIQNRVSQSTEANPDERFAGNVVGGIMGSAPMVMAAPAAFGAGTGPLLARSGAAALSGAAVNVADTAARKQTLNPDELIPAAGLGALTGSVGPVIGQAIGAGVRGIANSRLAKALSAETGLPAKAIKKVAAALGRDAPDMPGGPAAALDRLGPEATLMDIGPNLRQQAGSLAATPGPAQTTIRSSIAERTAGANQRMGDAITENLGDAPIPSQVQAGIRQSQQALSPEYTEVLRGARAVDTTPVAEGLEQQAVNLRGKAQRAVQQVRQMLNVTGENALDPNPGTLLQTRHAIDGMLDGEADANVIRALTNARRGIDDELARAVPGIKDVDAKYAELARQNTAVDRGQQVLDSGRTSPRPAELAQEVQEGALPQGTQIGPSAAPFRLRQGTRAEIDRIVGTNANDVAAVNRIIKGEGDWNRQKLETLFGKDRSQRLFDVLERERTFANTADVVTRNSESASRLAGQQDIAGAPKSGGFTEGFNFGGFSGVARTAATKLGRKVVDALINGNADQRNDAIAKVLSSKDKSLAEALMRLTQSSDVPAKTVNDIARSLVSGSGPTVERLRGQ